MRRGNDPAFVSNAKGEIVGVTLSADFTAEHEWGIKVINQTFGIPMAQNVYGLERRKITKLPESGIEWFEVPANKDHGMLAGFTSHETWDHKPFEYKNWERELHIYRPMSKPRPNEKVRTLAAAWDERSFAIISDDPDGQKNLKQIYDAFPSLDICIFLAGGAVFSNAGLCIAVASKLDKEIIEKWYEADKGVDVLKQEVEKMGILKYLEEKGKRYFACSPRRKEDGSIHFWLNPYDQQQNNSMWVTEQDLRDWCEGKGPIPKKKHEAK